MNKMKKYFVCIILLFCLTTAMAQDQDPLVGTWTGIIKSIWKERYIDPVDDRLVIRIQKQDNDYNIRIKQIDIKSGDIFYYRECTVTSSDDNCISFYVFEPMTYDKQDEEYYTYTSYYTLMYKKGVLYFTQNSRKIVSYDRYKNYLRTENWPGFDNKKDVPTYKDDGDW